MPRSPQEATRFTSTQPTAHSKATATTIPLSKPPPANETPSQKVNRLRDAARRAKMGQESSWDKVVIRGRVWADRAHRVTATGLILASVVAASFAALSFGEMIMANRGKKATWYKAQQDSYDRALAIAKEAEANGTLTSDLALFLNKERAIEQAEEEKKRRGTMWQRAKSTVFGGLKMDEAGSSTFKSAAPEIKTSASPQPSEVMHAIDAAQSRSMNIAEAPMAPETSPISRTAAEDSRIIESRQRLVGGPLDRMGEQTARSLTSSSQNLIHWLTGR